LGDAIAVALLDAKNFGNEDFNIFHPGGKLGSQFVKVKNLMRQGDQIPLMSDQNSISEILIEMTSKHLGCTGVLNQNKKLIGIITDGDLRRHLIKDFMTLDALALMTKNPIVVEPDMLAVEAIAIMNRKSITSLFVVEDKEEKDGLNVVGILHIHDCLRAGIV
jgi:arabinose-5-phosphate isomerase